MFTRINNKSFLTSNSFDHICTRDRAIRVSLLMKCYILVLKYETLLISCQSCIYSIHYVSSFSLLQGDWFTCWFFKSKSNKAQLIFHQSIYALVPNRLGFDEYLCLLFSTKRKMQFSYFLTKRNFLHFCFNLYQFFLKRFIKQWKLFSKHNNLDKTSSRSLGTYAGFEWMKSKLKLCLKILGNMILRK